MIALLALATLYVFSIGPVFSVVEIIDVPRGPVRRFYAPVLWMQEHTVLQRPLEWYLELWFVP